MRITRRAQLHAWRGRVRGAPASVAMVVSGAAAGTFGASLVGRWCIGAYLLTISMALVVAGLLRDDHHRPPPPPRPGERTVEDVLDEQRWRP